MNKAELNKIEEARAAAREKFKSFRDDDGDAADLGDPENPPLTDEQLARLRPAHDIHPALVSAHLRRRAGRPKSDAPKHAVSIRLDPDLIEALKASGSGWQTRVNDLLRKALGLTA